ncbi:molybdenum cofactor guanylyltransferase [Rubritalea halochordaticola]|uniref:Probable molybdenum cofactor guanylyltransferase n=1 Tax=Rubritalea halochordaticola TaxID=714537 RepID=A0ABP9UXB5_9BACT
MKIETSILLVGGKSTRMGQDKAFLTYRDNTPEYLRLYEILHKLSDHVYLSHPGTLDYGLPFIADPANGPLAAINAAAEENEESPLLVVACDLPLLEWETLEHLIRERDPSADATAYRSSVDGRPEPLCAIYEPSIFPKIKAAIENKHFCPRHLLEECNTKLVDLIRPHALMNANSPADTLEIRSFLEDARTSKSIELRYFAQLKEITGTDSESYQTESVTPSGLYEELKAKYHFPHKQKQLMLAINGDFADWATPLQEGDEVVFIPPVAGG